MIFNCGSRRSGTYWLQRIVTAHPAVGTVPSETHLFSHGIAPLLERFHEGDRDSPQVGAVYANRAKVIEAVRHLCDQVFGEFLEPGNERVAERTPLHVLHLDLIAEVYPDSQIVHIIRDGRDVARSIAAQDWGPQTVADATREWRDAVTAGKGSSLPPDRYLEVRYEALLAGPDKEVPRLLDWLGLSTSRADLAGPMAAFERPENVDRFGIGGIATSKWHAAFTDADIDAFMELAGDLLIELGYVDERPANPPRRRLRDLVPRRERR